MEELLRLGAIHRICIKFQYDKFRKFLDSSSALDRAYYNGMSRAYEFISSLFVCDLDTVLSLAYGNGKSK